MNSSNRESFTSIYAREKYTVLVAESRYIYVSHANQEIPLMPLFGQSPNLNAHNGNMLKKLEYSVALAKEYVLAMD